MSTSRLTGFVLKRSVAWNGVIEDIVVVFCWSVVVMMLRGGFGGCEFDFGVCNS